MRIRFASVATAFLVTAGPMTQVKELPLRIESKTSPSTVHNKRVFVVDVLVRNTSKVEQVLQTWQCSYGDWNWTTDNRVVHVQEREAVHCKKNPLVYMKLKPGETYERLLSIRAAAPVGEIMPQSVTFRIGCEPRLGYNLSTEAPLYIWSDPVTITIRGHS